MLMRHVSSPSPASDDPDDPDDSGTPDESDGPDDPGDPVWFEDAPEFDASPDPKDCCSFISGSSTPPHPVIPRIKTLISVIIIHTFILRITLPSGE